MDYILQAEPIHLLEQVKIQLHYMEMTIAVPFRATLILAGGIGITYMLRRFTASLRHTVWTAVFVMLLLLPIVMVAGASWDLPVLPASKYETAQYNEFVVAGTPQPIDESLYIEAKPFTVPAPFKVPIVQEATRHPLIQFFWPIQTRDILFFVWVFGFVAALISIGVGKVRWHLLVRGAEAVLDPDWHDALDEIRQKLGIHREVRLMMSGKISTPMTGGSLLPVILVPDEALVWNVQRMRMVLAHELVHVKRYDAFRAFLAKLALGVYWFNPLSWIAARMATVCREEACDEAVLAMGTKPSTYAQELLNMAERMSTEPSYAYLPMIRKAQLEQRILAILSPQKPVKNIAMSMAVWGGLLVFGLTTVLANPVTRQQEASEPIAEADNVLILSDDNKVVSVLTEEPVIAVVGSTVRSYTDSVIAAFPERKAWEVVLSDTSEFPERVKPSPVAPLETKKKVNINPDEYECEVPFGSRSEMEHSYHGTVNTVKEGGKAKYQYEGTYNSDRVAQIYRDGVRFCMRSHGRIKVTEDGGIKIWIDRESPESMKESVKHTDRWVVFEADGDDVYKMVFKMGEGVSGRSWTINGEEREWDEDASAWLKEMVALFEKQQELGRLNVPSNKEYGKMATLSREDEARITQQHRALVAEVVDYERRAAEMKNEMIELEKREYILQGSLAHVKSPDREGDYAMVPDDELKAEIQAITEKIKAQLSIDSSSVGSNEVPYSEELRAYEKEYRQVLEQTREKLEAEWEAVRATGDLAREERLEALQQESDAVRLRLAEVQMSYTTFDPERKIRELEAKIAAMNSEWNVEDRSLFKKAGKLEQEIQKHVNNLRNVMRRD